MKRLSTVLLAATLAAAVVSAACSTAEPARAAPATYRVDAAQSTLQFVTLKAGLPGVGGVAEVQRFTRFEGGLDKTGVVSLDIALASVDTGLGIRDDRIRTMLFNVAATPTARFSAQLDAATLAALASAQSKDINVQGSLTLAGQTRPVAAQLRVARLASGQLQVATRSPVVVDLTSFGLKPGVEALREVVALNFLAAAAPVSFALVLNEAR